MKAISTDNLRNLLLNVDKNMITKEYMGFLFEKFGEDYFKDPGDSPWEKNDENDNLKKILGDAYRRQPDFF